MKYVIYKTYLMRYYIEADSEEEAEIRGELLEPCDFDGVQFVDMEVEKDA